MRDSKSFCCFCIGFLAVVTLLLITNRDWIAEAQHTAKSHFTKPALNLDYQAYVEKIK